MPPTPTAHTTASWSFKAIVRFFKVYSVLITGIPGGKVEDDTWRVIMVTSNPLATSAEVIGAPKFPDACEFVNSSLSWES